MIFRARYLVPVSRPPVEDGALVVGDGRVLWAGSWADCRRRFTGPSIDLGVTAILPGLVNAHCHLDYTDMAGLIPPPKGFSEWIHGILALKQEWTEADYRTSWHRGADMLLASGTTTVGDIEVVPSLLPDCWRTTGLRVHSFLEMTCVRAGASARDVLEQTTRKAETLLAMGGGEVGLSPHAPYSTNAALLRQSAERARVGGWRVMTHVAESEEEFDMFHAAAGEMYEWLKRSGRSMDDCGLGTPMQTIARAGLLTPRFTAVHANYLLESDIRLLAESGAGVVHCPRSHGYFRHRPFDWRALRAAGVPMALGTDSLATVRRPIGKPLELNMFVELRAASAAEPDWQPADLLECATLGGARVLGKSASIGTLEEGKNADFVAVTATGPVEKLLDSIVREVPRVEGVWIGGKGMFSIGNLGTEISGEAVGEEGGGAQR